MFDEDWDGMSETLTKVENEEHKLAREIRLNCLRLLKKCETPVSELAILAQVVVACNGVLTS